MGIAKLIVPEKQKCDIMCIQVWIIAESKGRISTGQLNISASCGPLYRNSHLTFPAERSEYGHPVERGTHFENY
jgi:hypothetical protein